MSIAAYNLRIWLGKHGISQAEFARRVGVKSATICRYLNGTRCPGIKTIAKIGDLTEGYIKDRDWIVPYVA